MKDGNAFIEWWNANQGRALIRDRLANDKVGMVLLREFAFDAYMEGHKRCQQLVNEYFQAREESNA